jgi:hypothetical protein
MTDAADPDKFLIALASLELLAGTAAPSDGYALVSAPAKPLLTGRQHVSSCSQRSAAETSGAALAQRSGSSEAITPASFGAKRKTFSV